MRTCQHRQWFCLWNLAQQCFVQFLCLTMLSWMWFCWFNHPKTNNSLCIASNLPSFRCFLSNPEWLEVCHYSYMYVTDPWEVSESITESNYYTYIEIYKQNNTKSCSYRTHIHISNEPCQSDPISIFHCTNSDWTLLLVLSLYHSCTSLRPSQVSSCARP